MSWTIAIGRMIDPDVPFDRLTSRLAGKWEFYSVVQTIGEANSLAYGRPWVFADAELTEEEVGEKLLIEYTKMLTEGE